MRHALRRKYGRARGKRHKYKGWTIVRVGQEFDILDAHGRRRGFAMTWEDALELVDEKQAGHAYGERESGARDIDEMVRAASAPTAKPPPGTKTMWGQIEYDRALKALRGRKQR